MEESSPTDRDISWPLIFLIQNSKQVVMLSNPADPLDSDPMDATEPPSPLGAALYAIVEAMYDMVNSTGDVPFRVFWLSKVGFLLQKQFEQFGLVEDLIPAVNYLEREEWMRYPEDRPYRVDFLNTLRNALERPPAQGISISYFIAAVTGSASAEIICVPHLGPALIIRYLQTGSTNDLVEGIRAFEESMRISEDVSDRVKTLTDLIPMCENGTAFDGSVDRFLKYSRYTGEIIPGGRESLSVGSTYSSFAVDKTCWLVKNSTYAHKRYYRFGGGSKGN